MTSSTTGATQEKGDGTPKPTCEGEGEGEKAEAEPEAEQKRIVCEERPMPLEDAYKLAVTFYRGNPLAC